jgi:hypothetical protein
MQFQTNPARRWAKTLVALFVVAAIAAVGIGCGSGSESSEAEAENTQSAGDKLKERCFADYSVPADISACLDGDEPAAQEDLDADGLPDDTDPDPYSPENVAAEESEVWAEEESSEPHETVVGIGEGAKDDGLGIKVLSIERVESVSPADDYSDPVYAPPGGAVYKVVVEVKNYGAQAMDPFCIDEGAVLLDENDRNYKPINTSDLNDWVCLDGVAPGFKATTTFAYQVPKSFKLGGMVLWNTESSDYDGEQSDIVVVP